MMDSSKYRVGYFPVDKKYNKWVEKDHIEKPPVWCSVDMRDGNQSLVIPMSLEEKLEYYKLLLEESSFNHPRYKLLRRLNRNLLRPINILSFHLFTHYPKKSDRLTPKPSPRGEGEPLAVDEVASCSPKP